MRKMLFVLCLVIFYSVLSFAQLNYGIFAGGGFSSVRDVMIPPDGPGSPLIVNPGDQFVKNSFIFAGGLYVMYPINLSFSLQVEVLYAPKSLRIDHDVIEKDWNGSAWVNDDRNRMEFYLRLHYLEIPVLLNTHFDKFAVRTGLSLGILLGNSFDLKMINYNYDTNGNETSTDTYVDKKGIDASASLQSVVMNLHLGISYNLNDTMYIETRYVMGLTPFEKYYEISDEEMTKLSSMTQEERLNWELQHPYSFYKNFKDLGDNSSMETLALYLMVGYRF